MYHNAVILVGFLGKKPEKMKKGGYKVSLATNKSWKDKETGEWVERTEWHRIVAYGYTGDKLAKMPKGQHVLVAGELQYFEFESQDHGGKVRIAQINATNVTRLRSEGGAGGGFVPDPDFTSTDEDVPF